jgi:uncharacterized membrane protein
MDAARLWRHLAGTRRRLRRDFPASTLAAIERAIRASESTHSAEIRFVLEPALAWDAVLAGTTPRERAGALFATLGVWDTAGNNGVLVYVLHADRDIELLADRGWAGHVEPAHWREVCAIGEAAFRDGRFEAGALAMVAAVGELARRHFPRVAGDVDELPDRPLVL